MRGPRFVCAALFVATALSAGPATAAKRALLIGIESYGARGEGWMNLDGPGNDVALVRTVLRDRFQFPEANIRVLRDAQATRRGIAAAFETLIAETRAGDTVYIHYSGHGAPVPDANGDEGGGRRFDAALVPQDGGPQGAYYILDDEIALWMDRLLARTPDVLFVVDACHSGTITRSASSLRVRRAPVDDTRPYTWSDSLIAPLRRIETQHRESPLFVRLSACLDTQSAWEYEAEDGKTYGRFTWHWCRALLAAQPGQTVGEVFRSAQAMTASVPLGRQEARLEGAADRALFGGTFAQHGTQVAVLRSEGPRVTLNGGVLSGITPGSVFARAGAGAPLRLKIVSVAAVESVGEIEGMSVAAPGDLLEEVEHAPRLPPLEVLVETNGLSAWGERVRVALAGVREIRLVDHGVPDLLLRLVPEGQGARCEIRDGTEGWFGAGRYEEKRLQESLEDAGAVHRLVERVRAIIYREELLALSDAYAATLPLLEVGLTRSVARNGKVIQEPMPKSPRLPEWAIAGSGDTLTFHVVNRTLGEWFLYVVDLMPSGEVQLMFPEAGRDDDGRIAARGTSDRFRVILEDDGQVDTYLCFLSERPMALDDLTRHPLPAPGEPTTRGVNDEPSGDAFWAWRDRMRAGLRGSGAEGGQVAVRRFSIRVEAKGS